MVVDVFPKMELVPVPAGLAPPNRLLPVLAVELFPKRFPVVFVDVFPNKPPPVVPVLGLEVFVELGNVLELLCPKMVPVPVPVPVPGWLVLAVDALPKMLPPDAFPNMLVGGGLAGVLFWFPNKPPVGACV